MSARRLAALAALVLTAQVKANAQVTMAFTPRALRVTDSVITTDLARFDSVITATALSRGARAGEYVRLAREAYERNEAGPVTTQLLAAAATDGRTLRAGRPALWALLDSVYARPSVPDSQRAQALAFEAALLRAQWPVLGAPSCAVWEKEAERLAVALRVMPAPAPPPPAVVEKPLPPPENAPPAPAELRGVPSRVHFALDRSELAPRSQRVLDALVDSLRAFPAVRIVLEGHTDRRASAAYNAALSARRANTVQRYLVGKGIGAERIRIDARGKSQLEQTATGVVDHARNRRVMLRFFAPDGREIVTTQQLDDLQLERRR
ncbi:MAG: OmpA family protein [Gemmatimonadaceae bacterium]|jgi:outer membrane protein OmpA-like peptidoglycan-associated protein|nr:OmpA family protein [Gemmatimonadaceae bacterium]